MRIIEINALSNGAHRNQISGAAVVPDGWAIIPDNIALPDSFPFVDITVEGGIVTAMTAGTMPDPEPSQPTQLDIIEAQVTYTAMMTDTLLEV